MKFFSFIGKIFRGIVSKVVGFFKGKNPVDAINDTTKTIIGAATAGVSIYAAVNVIRAHIMPSNKHVDEAPRAKKSGAEYIMDQREAGSVESKLAAAKANTSRISRATRTVSNMKQEELNMLAEIAETRNAYFKELSPEEQMSVLNMEGFDFEAFRAQRKQGAVSPFCKRGAASLSIGDKPFREEKDYGIFNFIMRPISDFYHWAINDPVPKKCDQIHLIDLNQIPTIPCETVSDAVDIAQSLSSYMDANRKVGIQYSGRTQASAIEQQILIDEAFQHDSLDEYNYAVNRRLKASMATPSLYDLLSDEREGGRLDDERDRRRQRRRERDRDEAERETEGRRRSYSIFDEDDDGDDEYEDRERQRKNPTEAEADRRAQELIDYHMKLAHKGIIDRTGFSFAI